MRSQTPKRSCSASPGGPCRSPPSLCSGAFPLAFHFLSTIFYHIVNYSYSRTPPSLTPRHVPHATLPLPLFSDAS